MARDIFPHDRFEDTLYTNAVSGYGEAAKADGKLKKLLLDGVAKLDAEANKKFKKPYAEVEKEADRVSILKDMDKAKSEFFAKMRGDLVVSLYNQPAVWAKLGYEGPSADKGGYINRGFNDQTWMDRA
jgi:hypothetical protein